MPRTALWRISATQDEVDQRSREARLQVEHAQRLLALPTRSWLTRMRCRLESSLLRGRREPLGSADAAAIGWREDEGSATPTGFRLLAGALPAAVLAALLTRMKAPPITRSMLAGFTCLTVLATVFQAGYGLRLAGYASAAEQEPVPDWVVDGMEAALRPSINDAVKSEALLFTDPTGILRRIQKDRNAIIDFLIDRLSDGNPKLRSAAARALGPLAKDNKNKGKTAVDALILRLGDPDPTVGHAAAEALGLLAEGNKDKINDAIDDLITYLGDAMPAVRSAAAEVLGPLAKDNKDKGNAAVNALIATLGDPDPAVRSAAAQALGPLAKDNKQKCNFAIDALIARLGDRDPKVRYSAARALGPLAKDNKDKRNTAVDALIARLDDLDVRSAAAQALGLLHKRNAAIDVLIARLGNADPEVGYAAAQALGPLAQDNKERSDAAVDTLIARLGDATDPAARYFGAKALGLVAKDNKDKGGAAADALITLLGSDGDPTVRKFVAEVLGPLAMDNNDKGNAAVDALIARLSSDGDPMVRYAAAGALGPLAEDNKDKGSAAMDALIARLGDPNPAVRSAAAQALGPLARHKDKGNFAIDALIARLGDPMPAVRSAAAQALAPFAKNNKDKGSAAMDALIARLGDSDPKVISAAAEALTKMAEPMGEAKIVPLLGLAADRPVEAARMEAAFHILSGGDNRLSRLQPLLQPTQRDAANFGDDPEKTLELFVDIWPATTRFTELRQQIAWHAKNIAAQVCSGGIAPVAQSPAWLPGWAASLRNAVDAFSFSGCLSPTVRKDITTLSRSFHEANLVESSDLERLLRDDKGRERLANVAWWGIRIVAAHGALWITLLWLYPRYTWVQAAFFWNPWVRKLLGLHLSLLIPLLPFARRRLLAPFRSALGPKSDSEGANVVAESAWFPDAEVTEGYSTERVPITRALPSIRGLTVLEGASGLGKTVHLVRLARDSKRVAVFIKAGEEQGNVMKAVAARLPAEVIRDEAFLRTLIHAGGLDICIDGLNEVSVEARAEVTSFAQSETKANVLISTQPIRWNRPAGARLLRLQPLRSEQRQDFLISREIILTERAPVRGDSFRARVKNFIREMNTTLPADVEEQVARERALSNPMDLTTIALILAQSGTPDLLNLQQTAYLQAAAQYKIDNQGAEFPLTRFSEHVYEQRCKAVGEERELIVLREPGFTAECDALSDQKLLLKTMESNPDAEGKAMPAWRFRHDKVLDFFLYVALTNPKTMKDRVQEHLADTRFRGVYLLLALRAPLDVAKEIRDRLADHAAETRDHPLSDEFWSIVRQRLEASSGSEKAESPADRLVTTDDGDGEALVEA